MFFASPTIGRFFKTFVAQEFPNLAAVLVFSKRVRLPAFIASDIASSVFRPSLLQEIFITFCAGAWSYANVLSRSLMLWQRWIFLVIPKLFKTVWGLFGSIKTTMFFCCRCFKTSMIFVDGGEITTTMSLLKCQIFGSA